MSLKRKTFLHQSYVFTVKYKGTKLVLSFTFFLDCDFSTLIANRNNLQFSQAVYAKSTGNIRRSCLFPFKNVPSWRYLCPFRMLLIYF
jgi:hypothetical protein